MRSRLLLFAAVLGPGLIAGLSDDDPAGITTYAVMGADHGYALLWVLVVATGMLVLYHLLGVRVGVATGQGMIGLVRERYGVRAGGAILACLLVANLGTLAAEYAGIAAALNLGLAAPNGDIAPGQSIKIPDYYYWRGQRVPTLAWLAITQEAQGIAGTTFDHRIEETDAPPKLILMSASAFRDPLIAFYVHHEIGYAVADVLASRDAAYASTLHEKMGARMEADRAAGTLLRPYAGSEPDEFLADAFAARFLPAPASVATAYTFPSPMFTRIGPGHIPVTDQPIPNSTPPMTLPRCIGFGRIESGAPLAVRPYRFSSQMPGTSSTTAVPMIPYSCRLVSRNIPWMKS